MGENAGGSSLLSRIRSRVWTLVSLLAVIFAAISGYYYLRVVMVMYMREPDPAAVPAPRFESSPALSIVLACALAGVVLLGLFPNLVVSLATQAVPLMK